MSEKKFTPGPWECGRNPKGNFSNEIVVRPKGEFPHGRWIADCGPQYDPKRRANARLIAAAPELYEALEELLAVDDAWHGSVNGEMAGARQKARAALLKARISCPTT